MKKVLLNTTALLAAAGTSMLLTAGIASADDLSSGVHIKGSAEMGVIGGDIDTQFWTDLDVDVDMSVELDNGLTFGASIDLDELGGGIPATSGPATVYIQGPFGNLTMGDTDGAFDYALKEAIIGGTINDVQEHAGYNGNSGLDGGYDGQIARYDNTFGDFSFAVSGEVDDAGVGDAILGAGVKYSMGNFGVGVGYQSNGTVDVVGLSLDATFGDFQAIVNVSDSDAGGGTEHVGFALGYTMNDLTLAMNWGEFSGGSSDSGWGAIVNYDLGGATLQAGYGNSDVGGATTDVWSVGVAVSF